MAKSDGILWHGRQSVNEAALQRLIDESEVRKLVQEHYRALDEANYDALHSLYTDDAVFEIGGQIQRGRQAIVDTPGTNIGRAYEVTYHHIGQIYVDLDGDEARGVAYVVAYHLPNAAELMKHEDGGGKFHVTARRTEDGWRLTQARLEVVFAQGDPMRFHV
ncbi:MULTISPECIES: nuclear transport factor 2 family protein [unclassified Streptomyces]|uniref:nuclear transport factor 2 family protein n=1 Tax=unclassified Streptomyces TaxID=2593676 RepID=UPI0022581CA8|nr:MULTISPECIES: nuclear transport factor 2 family protein [unclassified Streptomyces]WMD07136.1 nuclear transport factor 2 family protein [Streptomyces sp. FXY-T5]